MQNEQKNLVSSAPPCEFYAVGVPPTTSTIKGYDFNQGVNYEKILQSFATQGLQATHFSKAVEILNEAIKWRLSDEPLKGDENEQELDPEYRKNTRATIFLGYTSNQASCGNRDIIRYLAEHKMIDCIVTTTGGIQEDFMKCLGTFHAGEFNMDDIQNRRELNCRIGNILVPSENYIKLENFLLPIFEKMSKQTDTIWSPSKLINLLGKEINNPESIYYWCYKNNIPVFCPGITDGAVGDMLFTNSFKHDLIIDVVSDVKEISRMGMKAKKSCALILGGSIPKHHILNAQIWRNGADYGVFINTGLYEDGSDSGAKVSEAYTWGKLRVVSKSSKIFGEASMIFPLLVGQTFAKHKDIAARV